MGDQQTRMTVDQKDVLNPIDQGVLEHDLGKR